MDNEIYAEREMNRSGFVEKYVNEHREALDTLRRLATEAAFAGEWFIIGDENYKAKRLQYASTSFEESEVTPRIILYPAQGHGDEDIRKALTLCEQVNMRIAIRTGGHQYCGYSSTVPENMQIDLSETYPEYDYDADANILKCGVSHALGDWAAKNESNGIYLPMGVCAHVHLGGHVHTGGWGMVARSHGILADHVLAFDIILASGEKVHVIRPVEGQTDKRNDDLFFAVLGGSKGGDFGLVTHWQFRPLRDADYPNAASYVFAWLYTEERMEGVVFQMQALSERCKSGDVPSDYEFMLTITGAGKMNLLPESVKDELQKLGKIGDIISEEVPVPALIQMWMCFTNKDGADEAFDDQYFESFTDEDVCGKPLVAIRKQNYPTSSGLAQHFIMHQDREMEFPFIKRSRVTMAVKPTFPAIYTERMHEIMGRIGTRDRQHLVSQMQIYAGGAVAENGKAGLTAYSWRDQALAMSHDSFYGFNRLRGSAYERAAEWQDENDATFIGQQAYADKDMRMFAYTFGERDLSKVWACYYDSEAKYQRLQGIKGEVDPLGLWSADPFSVKG